ncbi:MAG: DNA polymerase III subunit delta [Candidatus Gracilibacteria bacterium]|nr:DNA polymerase III subunit delta [Candidatus Gracilibacteria bacterium]
MSNLYLFTGENFQALNEKLSFWKKEFEKKHSETNIEQFVDVKQNQVPTIINGIESQPFLAEKRMIIIRDLPQSAEKKAKLDLDHLQSSLEKSLPESSFVIFVSAKPDKRGRFYKFLKKSATIQEFPVLKGVQLRSWILQRAQQLGKTIDSQAADLLMYSCADNNGRIAGELDKLSLLDAPHITQEHVKRLVDMTPEAKIFQALDKIGSESPQYLLKAFDQLVRSGEALPLIFFMIVRQFRLLLQVKSLLDSGSPPAVIQKRIKLAPFQVSMLTNQARGLSLAVLKKAYRQLAEIDLQIKTGKIPFSNDKTAPFQIKIDQFLYSLHE